MLGKMYDLFFILSISFLKQRMPIVIASLFNVNNYFLVKQEID